MPEHQIRQLKKNRYFCLTFSFKGEIQIWYFYCNEESQIKITS